MHEALYQEHGGLVAKVARQFRNLSEWEDVHQTAALGFVKACLGYCESHGVRFSTYAWRVMSNECLKLKAYRHQTLSYEPCVEHVFYDDQLAVALTPLTQRERWILWQRAHGRTLREIGAEVGLSLNRVKQIETGALGKARGCVTVPTG